MSANAPLPAGWNDMDEYPVAVRDGQSPAQADAKHTESPMPRFTHTPWQTTAAREMQPASESWRLRLSAIVGVAIVLITAAFYVGIGTLRSSLTDGLNDATVTITADGHFAPSLIDVAAGTTLVIRNENAEPQVLKIKEGNELFPVQVVFTEPFTFTVPADVTGTFVYVSETLPSDEILTISVTAPMETSALQGSNEANDASLSLEEIPLPFFDIPVDSPTELSTASSSAAANASSEHDTEPATISLDTSASVSSSFASMQPTKSIEINPYTVSWGKDHPNDNATLVKAADENLHSGAPLETYRPANVAKTGPEAWMLTVPALMVMMVVYRRMQLSTEKR